MSRHIRQGLLVVLLLTLVFTLGWTYDRQAAKQHETEESYALPARYEKMKDGIMVFCYHRVLKDSMSTEIAQKLSNNSQLHEFNVPASAFAKQMAFLKKHHIKVISASTMTRMIQSHRPIKGKYVVLTFDDIDRSVIDNAIPVMRHYNFPFTTFVITGNTGRYREGSQMATWSQIKGAQDEAGHLMTLGLHTHNMHYLDSKMQPVFLEPHTFGKFQKDFATSVTELKEHTGVTATSFAYPYGGGTRQINNFLAQQDLDWVATLDSGIVSSQTNLNETPRLIINQESWPSISGWLVK
ncbi:polysaccharide deacetylase family protein [Levilactobacillus lanxiensis]|uniref:Polysaccharide deacetylase family protein n=1 Tax=Levilactobacillus lanxiensis TaxID=2799568 RepID=A0ABW4D9K9_9LACO|nr:polysaccharide deacetylase family protein [Levilactobacillus lanxiensis]